MAEDLSRYTVGKSKTKKTARKARPLREGIRDDVPLERTNARLYYLGIVVFVLLIGVTVTLLVVRANAGEEAALEEEAVDVVVDEVIITPEPAKPVAVRREEIRLDIANGAGVAGLAGETAEEFEALGYPIGEIGNAEKQSGSTLETDLSRAEAEFLLEDVRSELGITKISGGLSESEADARIILGE